MIVTIWRHGAAGQASTDRERGLTARGYDDIGFGSRQFESALGARGIAAPELILHSPWLRTTQTAGIIASAFMQADCRELPALRPDSSVASVDSALIILLESAAPLEHVLLISHQPLVSQLIEHYLGERGRVPPLSPGASATLCLEAAASGCGTLLFWSMPPEFEAGM